MTHTYREFIAPLVVASVRVKVEKQAISSFKVNAL